VVGLNSRNFVRFSILFACLLIAQGGVRADIARDAEEHGDIEVGAMLDSSAQSGSASATVRIHARREIVWALVTSCAEELKMVPGLISCEVLETAPDRTWQRLRQVVDYSWYLPRLTYELRAVYQYPERVSIERTSGDLSVLKSSWYFESDGDFTIAHYSLDLAPGFWVPRWLVRAALRHDLPKLLRSLRARAESVQQGAS
jgi:Polyketide cyclase / dehydrase and lipid transport